MTRKRKHAGNETQALDLFAVGARRQLEQQFLSKAALMRSDEKRIELARALVRRLVRGYWKLLKKRIGVDLPLRRCPFNDSIELDWCEHECERFIQIVASAPDERAAYQISGCYASLLPQATRSLYGMFFTPPALADRLLQLVTETGFDWRRARIIDPACGGGAFLAPVAARVAKELAETGCDPRAITSHIGRHLRGIELDPFLAWLAEVFLDVSLFGVIAAAGKPLPHLVTCADALSEIDTLDSEKFDLVVGNPPYGRIRLSSRARRKFYDSLYGHANLYGVFTHLALQLSADKGIVAYITPTSFLGGQYFRNLRRLLLESAPPLAIDFVHDRNGIFEQVLQETALVVFQRSDAKRPVRVHFLKPETGGLRASVASVGRFSLNGQSDAPWILPRTPDDIHLLRKVNKQKWRLRDYGYSVSTGPLVWNRYKERLRSQEGEGCYPLIWAESVRPDGTFAYQYTRRNHAPFFEVRENEKHFLTREPCVLVQRTTAKEQSRRLIAAPLPKSFIDRYGPVVVENHLNMVRPPGGSGQRQLFHEVSVDTIAALLNSHVADRLFRCISGSVAVSAFELEALPLPDPETLVTVEHHINSAPNRDSVERIICRGYGLSNGI